MMPGDVDDVKMGSMMSSMTPSDPTSDSDGRTYHHGDLANALLDAVEAIVSERGVFGVSLREAARRAGVSHSAPAHHFGDKEGMLEAFAQQGFDMLADAMTEAYVATAAGPLRDQLRAMGRCYLRFAVEHPAHYEVMFSPIKPHEEETQLHDVAGRSFIPLALMVNQLGEAGIIPPEAGRYAATMLWSMCHGLASMWIDDILPHFYEDHTYDDLIDGVLDTTAALLFSAPGDS